MEKKYDREFLLACAKEFLNWMALQDPAYGERIEITKSEYKLDDLQTLASYVARTLDLGEHMYFCDREFMNSGYAGHKGPRKCVVCDTEFTPERASDEMCGKKDCADAFYAIMDKKFESKGA